MAESLDRAWVINGEDLRVILEGGAGRPPLVPNPRDVAQFIVTTIGKPLDGAGVRVTREQVEAALAGVRAAARDHQARKTGRRGRWYRRLAGVRAAVRDHQGEAAGEIAYPAAMVFEPGTAAGVPRPECGPGQAAHIQEPAVTAVDACCEHVQADAELATMGALAPALGAVSALSPDARERVMDWARRRADAGQTPS